MWHKKANSHDKYIIVQYKKQTGVTPVAHTCNPSYSGGRDQGESQFEVSPRQIVLEMLSQTKQNKTQHKKGLSE
jgi:hypothetical protein